MNVYVKKQQALFPRILMRVGLLIVLLIVLNIFQPQVKNVFYTASYPLMNVLKQSGGNLYTFFQSAFNFNSLRQENSNLKEENENLLVEISLLQSYVRQGQSVQEALQSVQGDGLNITRARVIGLDVGNDYVLIDKGLKDGIAKDMPIISSQKVLFGKVIEVYDNYAQVMLISSKTNVLDVRVQSDDATKPLIHGVVKGKGVLTIYLDLVNPDAQLADTDTLITSGLEANIPANLLVGKVISVTKDDLKPFQTATVQPFFDVKTIDNVFIITNSRAQSKN